MVLKLCVINVLCLSCFRVCSLLPCGHLLGKSWPLGFCLWCLIVILTLSHDFVVSWFRCGTLLYWIMICLTLNPMVLLYIFISFVLKPSCHAITTLLNSTYTSTLSYLQLLHLALATLHNGTYNSILSYLQLLHLAPTTLFNGTYNSILSYLQLLHLAPTTLFNGTYNSILSYLQLLHLAPTTLFNGTYNSILSYLQLLHLALTTLFNGTYNSTPTPFYLQLLHLVLTNPLHCTYISTLCYY